MATTRQILKITTLFGGVQGLNILLNLVRTKLAAVILGPSGIGLNSIYDEMRELIHTTTNLGMDVSGVREVSQAYEKGDMTRLQQSIQLTRSWVMLLALAGALICLLLSEPLSWLTFSDFAHTWDFALLAPSVMFSTLTCGEMAILKGLRKIKVLAIISVLDVVAGIATTIPVYYIWGMAGIVPAIVLSSLVLYLIAICYSYHEFPPIVCIKGSYLRKGLPMLAIGMSLVLAGIVNHGSELAIRTYLNNVASLNTVGLYSAGYTFVMAYGGVIFASLDNDFFPRVSGIFSDRTRCQDAMDKQIGALLMLTLPLVIIMMLLAPVAIPLLFSGEFSEVVTMAQIGSMALLFRAVLLPARYMPLAAGDSKSFLCLEILSYLVIFVSVVAGYHFWSLLGTGIALVASNCFYMLVLLSFVRWRYGIRLSMKVIQAMAVSAVLLGLVLAICLM